MHERKRTWSAPKLDPLDGSHTGGAVIPDHYAHRMGEPKDRVADSEFSDNATLPGGTTYDAHFGAS